MITATIARQEEEQQQLKHLVASQQAILEAAVRLLQEQSHQGNRYGNAFCTFFSYTTILFSAAANNQALYQQFESVKAEIRALGRTIDETAQAGPDLKTEVRNVMGTCK